MTDEHARRTSRKFEWTTGLAIGIMATGLYSEFDPGYNGLIWAAVGALFALGSVYWYVIRDD